MTYETLYKRTKTGAIQQWDIKVVPMLEGSARIVKTGGQVGGVLTPHAETIREGKNIGKANETSPSVQAGLQAASDWKRKHDEGYKSLSDLGINTHEDLKIAPGVIYTEPGYPSNPLAGQTNMLESVLKRMLPKFNTDASGNVKPMLAKAVDWKKVTYPCLVQPKLDGVRCLMVVERDLDETAHSVKFLSRSGKEYTTLAHIASDVRKHTHSTKSTALPFILDGEVYSDELTFQEIISAVKKQRPDSLKLKFRAYDIVNDAPQDKRWISTFALVRDINSEHVQVVQTTQLYNKEDIMTAHNTWVSQGYEGAMIRLRDGLYGQGQRSSTLLKVKEFDETEFLFSHFEFGQRGVEDLLAVCYAENKEKFKAKMIGTLKQKEEVYNSYGEMMGSEWLTVKHFGLTTDGLPRFPIGKGFRLKEDT